MSRVILQGYIEIPDSELPKLQSALVKHIRLTRAEPGCIKFHVTKDESNPNRLNVYEEFVDQAAFDFHQMRTKRSFWGRASLSVIRNYTITVKD